MALNLNEEKVRLDNHNPGEYTNVIYNRQEQMRSLKAEVNVYFDYLPKRLCDHVEEADATVGCIAWLTHFGILDAISHHPTSIIVQKEDFLRPDLTARGNWTSRLRQAYDSLQDGIHRWNIPSPLLENLSACSLTSFDTVRCVGNYNADKKPAFPRAHHKFLVFLRKDGVLTDEEKFEDWVDRLSYTPYAVWTGSFNFTENAAASFENAVYIQNRTIAQAYLDEFVHLFALSEPLDWHSQWVEPEYRIGT